ncbi:hypothetical protein GK091_24205 [Spirosoma agri]|uniref:Novel STAND NTPase 1 domain-containing protein n=1 Tax=Spirosoma agri TaxID=1987381 RepID=A0A6M0INY5_9BACT|nr:hypothetical protein [Spirosoma agri]NEU70006.1 hypothetical protein [Spirosoma agri]
MIDATTKVAYTNPFPGLRSFDRADSYLFFGRDNQIRDLKEKLLDSRFLAIIGSSGSGKSSLIKAGLIAQLVNGPVTKAAFKRWQIVFFNPEATPYRNFAQALHQSLSEHNQSFATHFSIDSVEKLIRTDSESIVGLCENTNLLLIIDQFEELFRYQQQETNQDEITGFINLIIRLSQRQDYSVYVILAMRSDYLDQCTNYVGLTEAINHGYYLLPKMNRDEIRQAIETPASVMGACITDELTTRLLNDIGAKADRLPILQHALMRTWNHWQKNHKTDSPIGIADYEAIGTMQRAITLHAEAVYGDLPDEKSQLATEKLFKALIVVSEGDEGFISPASIGTISQVAGTPVSLLIDVLNRFREPGVAFLTPPLSVNADSSLIIDVSHERIINLWDRLQSWVREETDSAKFYQQVSSSAMLYQQGQVGLWTNPELQIGLKWLAENRPTQAWANRYDPYLERATNFLDYSRQQYDFEIQNKEERQRKELRRARSSAIFLGIGALVSLVFLIVSMVLRTNAQQSENQAIKERKVALDQRSLAEAQTREAITQKKIAEQQEIITEQQKKLTDEQRNIAVVEKSKAESQKQIAEEAQINAEKQKDRAQAAQVVAESQKQIAQEAQRNAEKQKDLAQLAQVAAEKQKLIAQKAQSYAEQQRGKAIARSVAVQSYQMAENAQDDLPALLALEAYTLNLKNGGEVDNPEIFNALSKAADVRPPLRRHTDIVRALALSSSPNEVIIASGSDDGTVKLWTFGNLAQPPRSLMTRSKNPDGIRAVAFDKHARNVYGASESGLLYSWSLNTTETRPTIIKAHTGPISALLTTADFGMLISIGADGHIRSWKPTATGLDSVQHVRAAMPLHCGRLSPDGKRLFCGSSNGRMVSFDLANLKNQPVVFTRREFGNRLTALAFNPSGDRLITGSASGLVVAWTIAGNEPEETGQLLSSRHTSTVNDITFSPHGKLLATCSADWSIHIWDYNTLSQQQQPIVINAFDSWVMSIRFSSDNKYLVACGADKTVRIHDIDVTELYASLTKKIKRNMTPEEWSKYIGNDIPYEKFKTDY